MLTWRQRIEVLAALAIAEAVAWIVLAREIRRRVEQAIVTLDGIEDRFSDLRAMRSREVN